MVIPGVRQAASKISNGRAVMARSKIYGFRAKRGTLLPLDNPRAQHHAGPAIVQLQGEHDEIPGSVWPGLGQVRDAAKVAIDVCLPRVSNCANVLAPLYAHLGKLLEQVLAEKPFALLLE